MAFERNIRQRHCDNYVNYLLFNQSCIFKSVYNLYYILCNDRKNACPVQQKRWHLTCPEIRKMLRDTIQRCRNVAATARLNVVCQCWRAKSPRLFTRETCWRCRSGIQEHILRPVKCSETMQSCCNVATTHRFYVAGMNR